MLNRTKQYVTLVLLPMLLVLMSPAKGMAVDLQSPQQVIVSISAQLQEKFQDKTFTKNFPAVVQFVNGVIDPHTDFDEIAPLVLGKYWKTATKEEQGQFNHAFQTLLVRVYSEAFIEYHDWTIRYLPIPMSDNASKVIVKTYVIQPGQPAIEIDYRMLVSNGEWKVYDIIIDGISLVTNYRSSFDDEIQRKGSLNALINALVKRNTEALTTKRS